MPLLDKIKWDVRTRPTSAGGLYRTIQVSTQFGKYVLSERHLLAAKAMAAKVVGYAVAYGEYGTTAGSIGFKFDDVTHAEEDSCNCLMFTIEKKETLFKMEVIVSPCVNGTLSSKMTSCCLLSTHSVIELFDELSMSIEQDITGVGYTSMLYGNPAPAFTMKSPAIGEGSGAHTLIKALGLEWLEVDDTLTEIGGVMHTPIQFTRFLAAVGMKSFGGMLFIMFNEAGVGWKVIHGVVAGKEGDDGYDTVKVTIEILITGEVDEPYSTYWCQKAYATIGVTVDGCSYIVHILHKALEPFFIGNAYQQHTPLVLTYISG